MGSYACEREKCVLYFDFTQPQAIGGGFCERVDAASEDPIFAAIAEHKRLWAAVNATTTDEETKMASDAEAECLRNIIGTVPASKRGMLAWIEHLGTDMGFGANQVDEEEFAAVLATFRGFVMRGGAAQ